MALTDTVDDAQAAGGNVPEGFVQNLDKALARKEPENVRERPTASGPIAETEPEKAARYLENARRMQAGEPTIEEEGVINVRRILSGQPTTHEVKLKRYRENARRIQQGLPTIEEEERRGGGGGGAQANWLTDKLDRAQRTIEGGVQKAADWVGNKVGLAENDVPQPLTRGPRAQTSFGALVPVEGNEDELQAQRFAQANAQVVPQTQPPYTVNPLQYVSSGMGVTGRSSPQDQPHVVIEPPENMRTRPPSMLQNALMQGQLPPRPQPNTMTQDMQAQLSRTGGLKGAEGYKQPGTPPAAGNFNTTGGSASEATQPFTPVTGGVVHVPGQSVPGQDPALINQYLTARNRERTAVADKAQYDAQTAHQLAEHGVFNDNDESLNFIQRQANAREREAKIDKAQQELDSYKIDPEHFQKHRTVGNRVLMGIAAGLVGFGNSMNKVHGNSILDMLEQEKQRDIDAQKSEKSRLGTAAQAAVNAGLRGQEADAFVSQHITGMGQKALASIMAARQPASVVQGARQLQAVFDQRTAEDNMKLHPFVPAHDVGVGGIPQHAKDKAEEYAKSLVLKSGKPEDFQAAYQQSLRTQGYASGGGTPSGFQTGAGGTSSRGIQTAAKLQFGITHANLAESKLLAAIEAKKNARMSSSKTAGDAVDRTELLNDIKSMLAGGNAASEQDHSDAEKMLPKDMNSYDPRGNDMEMLNRALKNIRDKRDAYSADLKNLKTGPFEPVGGNNKEEEEDLEAVGGSRR